MRKLFSLLAAVLFAGSMMAADVLKVTLDFTDNTAWQIPVGNTSGITTDSAYSNGTYTIRLAATTKYYFNNDGYLMLGKANSTLTLPAFDFDVTKIVVTGRTGASGSTKQNIFVGETAVSTETTGATGVNEYAIAAGYQAAGNVYVLKVTSAHNTQITKIDIYGKGEGGVTPPQPAIASPYCQTEVGHFFAANADPNSFVLLSIGSKGGKTIVRIDQDAAKNTQMFDYLQVTGLATDGADVAEGGATAMAVEFATPAAVDDSITLEILWSNPGWPGRWMVQNVKVPATAECEYAVLVPAPVVKKTCAEVYSLAKNDAVALNDVVVTYVNGKNVWVKDATASMLVFLPAANDAIKAGDVLSEVAGVVDIYNGVYEVKPSAEQVTAIVATPGEAPAAEVVTEVALTDVNKYIVMQNVEFAEEAAFAEGTQSNITINGVTVRNQFKNGYSFTAGKKYNIYGVVTIYHSTPQVYFITAEEASSTAIDNTVVSEKAIKMFENGQLIIIKNGVKYNALGSVIE